MVILGLDSSAQAAGAGIVKDGRLLSDVVSFSGRTHSETLLTLMDDALKNAYLSFGDVDALAVSNGPGSFTGIRIGVSAVKGLCFASGLPVYGISTLEALAVGAALPGFLICPVMDARCSQVYTAFFELRAGALRRLTPDRALTLDALAVQVVSDGRTALLVGDGAALTSSYFSERQVLFAENPQIFSAQHGSAVAFAAWTRYNNGEQGAPAERLQPGYLRPSQAEREREKREGRVL